MTKKTNRISVAKFEKLLDKEKTISIPVDGLEDVVIDIKKTIGLEQMIELVETVVKDCVDMDEGTYIPQILDFSLKRELLTKYANFAMPLNISKQYELIYSTNVVDIVLSNINQVQFKEIVVSIDKKIKFTLDSMSSVAAINVVKMIEKLNSIADNSDIFNALDGINMSSVLTNLDKIATMDENKILDALKQTETTKV